LSNGNRLAIGYGFDVTSKTLLVVVNALNTAGVAIEYLEDGKRRIIEFFIYPLIRYLDEGINVR